LTDQEKEALAGAGAVMHLYFDRLNARDEAGIRERAFHFPHARFHGNGITVLARPEDFKFEDFLGRSDNSGWHHSTWDYYEPIDVAPTKVHYRVSFSRWRADGTRIGSFRSLYICILKDGRWGIQGRSSWAA